MSYLNEHEVKKQPWQKFRNWVIVPSPGRPVKGKFLGLFELGRFIRIRKVMEAVKLQKEVWIKE